MGFEARDDADVRVAAVGVLERAEQLLEPGAGVRVLDADDVQALRRCSVDRLDDVAAAVGPEQLGVHADVADRARLGAERAAWGERRRGGGEDEEKWVRREWGTVEQLSARSSSRVNGYNQANASQNWY